MLAIRVNTGWKLSRPTTQNPKWTPAFCPATSSTSRREVLSSFVCYCAPNSSLTPDQSTFASTAKSNPPSNPSTIASFLFGARESYADPFLAYTDEIVLDVMK